MIITVIASLMLLSTPAPASETSNAGAAPVEKAKEPKKICKRPDTTGSRLGSGKKVCMTAQEWKKLDSPAH